MADLIALNDRFDVAFANDPDADRHGIVTARRPAEPQPLPRRGDRLPVRRRAPRMARGAGVGKTMVSSSIIDRVVAGLGRRLEEVPVGFKWFVGGLLDGTLAFGGEESAGASFLRRNGHAWSTDKDGLIMCLLAAEMTARTGKDPARLYADLTDRYGAPVVPPRRRPRDARAEAGARRPLARGPDRHRARGRADHRGADGGAVGRAARRASRSSPTAAGSRHGRRAPRTCTSSTPRASRAPSTSSGSSRRRRRSSTLRSGADHVAGLLDRAGGRRGQAASAADRRPGEAGGAVRRRVPADRLRAVEPRQRGLPADRRADPVQEPLARPPHLDRPGGCRRCWATTWRRSRPRCAAGPAGSSARPTRSTRTST